MGPLTKESGILDAPPDMVRLTTLLEKSTPASGSTTRPTDMVPSLTKTVPSTKEAGSGISSKAMELRPGPTASHSPESTPMARRTDSAPKLGTMPATKVCGRTIRYPALDTTSGTRAEKSTKECGKTWP